MGLADEVIWLVEVGALTTAGAATTLYFSTGRGFVTTPSDTPSSQFFDPRVRQALSIQRTWFGEATTRGRSTTGYGDIVLLNGDAGLDAYRDYAFDGQTVTVKRGTPLTAYASFTTDFVGTMSQPEWASGEFRLKIRDQQAKTQVPMQTTKYLGSGLGTLEGTSELTGKPKPIVYGQVFNIAPPVVETAKLIFQCADRSMSSVDAVYDRGVSLRQMYGDYILDVDPSGTVWKSSDHGDNWSTLAGHGTTNALGIAYGGGAWCVVDGITDAVTRSIDGGATWSTVLSATTNLTGVRFANNTFVALGQDRIYYSTDYGATWTTVIVNNTTSFINYRGIAFGVDRWVLVGSTSNIYYSLDLKNWTVVAVASAAIDVTYSSVLGLFVVVGGAGTPAIQTSPDAIGWTSRTVPASHTAYRYDRVTCSSSIVVAVGRTAAGGTDGIIATAPTTDASTWTARTLPTATLALMGVCYDGTYFVAAGADTGAATHKKIRSADGITWVAPTTAGSAGAGTGDDVAAGYGGTAASYATTTDLLDDTKAPAAGTFKAYFGSEGTYFRLGASPSGLVTADVTEGSSSANRTTAQVYKKVLTDRAAIAAANVSSSDITALDTAASYVIGLYVDAEMQVNTALDMVANSVGAGWFVDKSGTFRIKQLTAPAGSAVVALTSNDILKPLVKVTCNDQGQGLPVYSTVLRYKRYWTTQESDVATSVTDARKADIKKEWREYTANNSSVLSLHPLSPQYVEETLLTDSNAQTEATRRQALREVRRDIYEIVVRYDGTNGAVELGDVVTLSHSRYGLSVSLVGVTTPGQFRVIGAAPDQAARSIRWTLWGGSPQVLAPRGYASVKVSLRGGH